VKKLKLRLEQSIRHALRVHRAEREAREHRQAREEFLAIVAHDLRTPLGVILLSSNALREAMPAGPSGDDARDLNAMVERAAKQMDRRIHDLLDGARIDAARRQVDLQERDPVALQREAADLPAPPPEQEAMFVKKPRPSKSRS
jgi:signal transduction histidine kinase